MRIATARTASAMTIAVAGRGDLGVRVALDLVHPDNRARGGRERRERALDVDSLGRQRRCRQLRRRARLALEHPLEALTDTPPRRAQVHEAARDRDLPQPGAERRLLPELPETLEQNHHGVLEHVLGSAAVAEQAADECKGRRRDGGIDQLPRALLPRARSLPHLLRHGDFHQPGHGSLRCTRREKGRTLTVYSKPMPEWRNW
jgi:hypothetical protein